MTKAVRTRVRPVNIRQSISGLSWVWALEALGATTDSSALPSRGGSPSLLPVSLGVPLRDTASPTRGAVATLIPPWAARGYVDCATTRAHRDAVHPRDGEHELAGQSSKKRRSP